MKKNSLVLALVAFLLGSGSASWADVVYLKSGGKMEGRIVNRTDDSVEIDVGAGSLTLPMSNVDRIEEGRSPLDDYDERAGKLAADDRDGWLDLARWASGKGLGAQSRQAYERVLRIDPDDPANNFYDYLIDEEKCDGCGKCVMGCKEPAGLGSIKLEVRHDTCLACNRCSISTVCPDEAYELRPTT